MQGQIGRRALTGNRQHSVNAYAGCSGAGHHLAAKNIGAHHGQQLHTRTEPNQVLRQVAADSAG